MICLRPVFPGFFGLERFLIKVLAKNSRINFRLTESQTGNSDNDALLIWFNGGPGCSSVGGMFEELGPFYVDKDGKTVYENIYSWNKVSFPTKTNQIKSLFLVRKCFGHRISDWSRFFI